MWANWANVLLGVWLVIAPFIIGYNKTSTGALWNDIILGFLVGILAYIGTTTSRKA